MFNFNKHSANKEIPVFTIHETEGNLPRLIYKLFIYKIYIVSRLIALFFSPN